MTDNLRIKGIIATKNKIKSIQHNKNYILNSHNISGLITMMTTSPTGTIGSAVFYKNYLKNYLLDGIRRRFVDRLGGNAYVNRRTCK